MEVSRGVTLTYIGTAILSFVIFEKALGWAWQEIDALQQHVYFGVFQLTWLLAVGLTAILIYWLKTNPDVDSFIQETVVELRKVTWPSGEDTWSSAVEVSVLTIIWSFFLWGADQVWRPVTDYILTLGF